MSILFPTHTDPAKQSDDNNMVVPPSCPGLNVEILVDDQPLEEYDDVDESAAPPNTITKYIEAQSNAYFAVRVKFDHEFLFPASDINYKIFIDQECSSSSLIPADDLFTPSGRIARGRKTPMGDGTNTLQKFRFIPLDLGEFQRGFRIAATRSTAGIVVDYSS
jgi:hypothetical protein